MCTTLARPPVSPSLVEPPAPKRPKLTVKRTPTVKEELKEEGAISAPFLYCAEEILHRPLGNERYLVVVSFNKELYVHVCEYKTDPKNNPKIPTKTGMTFTPQRYAKLLILLGYINERMKLVREGKEGVLSKLHIGEGYYCVGETGFACVNLRRYFVPPGNDVPYRLSWEYH